ncbi:MAG: hypothetical protein MHM6MM_005229 [Cercozoa sp. M6MM]
MDLKVDPRDVLQLIDQFLAEQGLVATQAALRKETGNRVRLNAVSAVSRSQLGSMISAGEWPAVLSTLASVSLPLDIAAAMLELIVLDVAVQGDSQVALQLLSEHATLQQFRQAQPGKFRTLQVRVHRIVAGDQKANPTPEELVSMRKLVREQVLKNVSFVTPHRLTTLLGESLLWKQATGQLPVSSRYDLLQDSGVNSAALPDELPSRVMRARRLPKKGHLATALFVPRVSIKSDESQVTTELLLACAIDDIVELWDVATGTVVEHLLLSHRGSNVTALAVTKDGKLLASCDASSIVRVWRMSDGRCIRKIDCAGVLQSRGTLTSLAFDTRAERLLVGGASDADTDGTCVGVLGLIALRSGRLVKRVLHSGAASSAQAASMLRSGSSGVGGDDSGVRCVAFSPCQRFLVSGGNDGCIAVFDADGVPLRRMRFQPSEQRNNIAITGIDWVPSGATLLPLEKRQSHLCVLVTTASTSAGIIDVSDGKVLHRFSTSGHAKGAIVSAALSRRAQLVYLATEDGVVYAMAPGKDAWRTVAVVKAHERAIDGMAVIGGVAGRNNVMATWALTERALKLWSDDPDETEAGVVSASETS